MSRKPSKKVKKADERKQVAAARKARMEATAERLPAYQERFRKRVQAAMKYNAEKWGVQYE